MSGFSPFAFLDYLFFWQDGLFLLDGAVQGSTILERALLSLPFFPWVSFCSFEMWPKYSFRPWKSYLVSVVSISLKLFRFLVIIRFPFEIYSNFLRSLLVLEFLGIWMFPSSPFNPKPKVPSSLIFLLVLPVLNAHLHKFRWGSLVHSLSWVCQFL